MGPGLPLYPNEMVPLQVDLTMRMDGTCWCAESARQEGDRVVVMVPVRLLWNEPMC